MFCFQFSSEDFSPKDVAKLSSIDIDSEVIIETNPEAENGKSSYEEKITQLDEIMKDVRILEKQVNSFNADKDGKEFKTLDESLTKYLESLDGIDTCGIGHLQQRRKEIVIIINSLVSSLESKPANVPNVTELPTISLFINEALAPVEVQEVATVPISENNNEVSSICL